MRRRGEGRGRLTTQISIGLPSKEEDGGGFVDTIDSQPRRGVEMRWKLRFALDPK